MWRTFRKEGEEAKGRRKGGGIQLRTLYSISYTSITMFLLYRRLVCITSSSLFLFPLVFVFVSMMITWFFLRFFVTSIVVIWNSCDTFDWGDVELEHIEA